MSATLMVVPGGKPAGFTLISLPPANSMRVPSASASSRVSSSKRDTAAIVGSASPRNPSVAIERQQCVIMRHPVTIVDHANHALAADFHLDANRLRARIDGIFQQLFHHRRR